MPTVAKANALKLPFPDDSFDVVITRHTLEQMPKVYQKALDEIFRVSKNHVIYLSLHLKWAHFLKS